MSQRVQVDTALVADRRLKKQYNSDGDGAGTTHALPELAPAAMCAALGKSKGRMVSMGLSGKEGVISFIHNFDPDSDVAVWEHSDLLEAILPDTYGWYLVAESTTYNTKNVLKIARATVKIAQDRAFYLQSIDGAPTECLVSGIEDDMNPNTDKSRQPA